MHKLSKVWMLLLCLSVFLTACSSEQDKWEKQLAQQATATTNKLDRLKQHIAAGNIANASLLTQYASILKQDRPELSELSSALSQDAGTSGPIIRSLESRLDDARNDISTVSRLGKDQVSKVYQELSAIESASNPETYGMMLSDPINVLADMSNGKLARVAALSAEASTRINDAEDFGPGSQLVGNPQYGGWQTNSSGNSFWHWYGQYAFFSSLFHRPIGFSNWGRNRDYSYYNDYGRSTYTSPRDRKSQQTTERRTREKFKRSGKSFSSPYAKTKHTTASVARKASKFQPKSFGQRSASQSSKAKPSAKSTTSSYRNSSYQSSRSRFGGK